MDLNHLKQEQGLVQHVQNKPASLLKEEILEDITQDDNEQQCVQGASTQASASSVNEACSLSLGDLLNVKHEPSDMDIESTVLQHMDIHYAINQRNTNTITEENKIMHDWNKSVRYNRLKEESVEDKSRGPRSYINTCDYCQKTFWRKPSLRQHIEYFHGERILRCQECDEIFNSRHYLQRHKTRIHNKPQCECGVCHELFMSMCILTAHVREAHSLDDIEPKSDLLSQEVHDPCPIAGDTTAVVGRTTQQHPMVTVKSELADAELELGPVVFQHMDSNYRPLKEEQQLD